jgi:hypothetical protein
MSAQTSDTDGIFQTRPRHVRCSSTDAVVRRSERRRDIKLWYRSSWTEWLGLGAFV